MPDSHFNASGSPARFARRALTIAFALAAMTPAASSFAAQGNAAPLAAERAYGALETVATFDGPMPTGVTVTETGRIFVNFPRGGDDGPFTVG